MTDSFTDRQTHATVSTHEKPVVPFARMPRDAGARNHIGKMIECSRQTEKTPPKKFINHHKLSLLF
jgi:hypothetical protein